MTITKELKELKGIRKVEGNPQFKTVDVEWDAPATEAADPRHAQRNQFPGGLTMQRDDLLLTAVQATIRAGLGHAGGLRIRAPRGLQGGPLAAHPGGHALPRDHRRPPEAHRASRC
ncbi:MAG: heavy-metal-associated domain-containing protein [Desulfobacterales bacterium]|nr:heavy-metal-associated domain-containing protein [Desulfobacterales bacterium]